jgi:uncharacterized protein (DUF4213/DUF364 family)
MRASARTRATTIYDLLVERAQSTAVIRRVVLGLNWSVADLGSIGLCYSPPAPPRTLAWPGSIAGRRASEVASWLESSEPLEATVAAAVINAVVNDTDNPCLRRATALASGAAPHLAVFEHFAPLVRGANVVVVGRYPGLDAVWGQDDYLCLERRSLPGTLPESLAPHVLSSADWVFITASSLSNHTLPSLLHHSRGAKIVLMGPSLPWLEEWADFGVHYIAGVGVEQPGDLLQVVSEGGGTRIFEGPVGYRLLSLE